MSCQNRNNGFCKRYAKKEAHRQAKRQNPLVDNPYENWECDAECEKTCNQFSPYPPRMTAEVFTEKQAKLLKNIPPEFHSAFSGKAWQDGHAYGYEEIISALRDLVSDFQPAIQTFETRIRKEGGK